MSKTKKILLIIAIICIVIGGIITILALAAVKFNIFKFNTVNFENKTCIINDDFENINVYEVSFDITFIKSDNNECKIIYPEGDQIKQTISVENNTLKVAYKDERKWYERIGFYWLDDDGIKIYLPKNEYEKLYISSVSGDICVPDNFTFSETDLESTSGEIEFYSITKNRLNAETVSGDLNIKNVNGSLTAKSTSGEIYISNISTKTINIKTTSGDISLIDAKNTENIEINSTSGDISINDTVNTKDTLIQSTSGEVSLMNFDSEYLKIETVSGDVEGSLLSEKVFITDTTSGDVDVPIGNSLAFGECVVSTTSGDISFKIKSK